VTLITDNYWSVIGTVKLAWSSNKSCDYYHICNNDQYSDGKNNDSLDETLEGHFDGTHTVGENNDVSIFGGHLIQSHTVQLKHTND
jgi:hypothetical protein